MQALPVFSLLFAATFWGTVWYPLRLLADAGIAGLWQALISYLVATALVLPVYWPRRTELQGRAAQLVPLVFAAGWCNVGFMLGMLEGTVLRVLLLFYLAPVWAVLLAWVVLGERLAPRTWVALPMALAGAALMLYDAALGLPLPTDRADWFGLTAGLAFAVTTVETRRLQAVSVTAKTLASWVGVMLVAAAGLGLGGHAAPDAPLSAWAGIVALGSSGFLAATLAVQYGATHLPVQRTTVILLFEIVAGAVSSAWLAGEYTGTREWTGGLLIAGAGLIAAAKADEVR
jgi:drug/metabolite transporter (DMT)-like permease